MKIRSDSMEVMAAVNDFNIKADQFKRMKVMYDSGVTSMVQLERFVQGGPMDGSSFMPPVATGKANHQGTVLVVDDSDALRRTMVRALLRAGFEVIEAPSGHAALEVAGKSASVPMLLITDVHMPGMDGPELAAQLTMRKPGLVLASASRLRMPRVWSVSGVCRVMKSARARRSSSSTFSIPNSTARSGLRNGSKAMTFMRRPSARLATIEPMLPAAHRRGRLPGPPIRSRNTSS